MSRLVRTSRARGVLRRRTRRPLACPETLTLGSGIPLCASLFVDHRHARCGTGSPAGARQDQVRLQLRHATCVAKCDIRRSNAKARAMSINSEYHCVCVWCGRVHRPFPITYRVAAPSSLSPLPLLNPPRPATRSIGCSKLRFHPLGTC
jgi:hypothetical protein